MAEDIKKFDQHSETNEHNTEQHSQQEEIHIEHKEARGDEGGGDAFSKIYSQIGDHPGFYWGLYKVVDLPKIIIDDGLHFYWNKKQMEEAGEFTMHHHKVVRASDHEPPAMNLSPSNMVAFEWIVMFIVGILFIKAGSWFRKYPKKAPKGLANLMEVMVLYVRDEIVHPNMPRKTGDQLLHYFVAIFFFILGCNLSGLIPGAHTATSSLAVTAGLALTALVVINITAIIKTGIGPYLKHLLGGAPWYFAPIMVPIEVLSIFVKPFALTIRLFANMSAGHIIIFSLLGILFMFNSIWVSPAIVGFSVFIYLLELLVAFIQAYVFTVLTAIFVGLAIGEHGGEEHAH